MIYLATTAVNLVFLFFGTGAIQTNTKSGSPSYGTVDFTVGSDL